MQRKEKEKKVCKLKFNFSFTVNYLKILLSLLYFCEEKMTATQLVKLSKQEQVLLVEFGSPHICLDLCDTQT